MRYFITIILFTILAISNSELIETNSSMEEINYDELVYLPISEMAVENNSSQNIHYSSFSVAKEEAIDENKYIMIKVEADNCIPCNRLNMLLDNNEHIKEIVSRHIKAVKINSTYDTLPEGLHAMGTPTLFLIDPKDENRVLMKLVGNEAIESLEESLESIIDDSYLTSLASL
jgi:hypothetical protein